MDAAVVPGLLLLVARDLLLHDPPRVLAWRLLHDEGLTARIPGWLAPAPSATLDRDPFALVLGASAVAFAIAYLVAALLPGLRRARLTLVGLAAAILVVLPSLGFMALGAASGRPYGQDGGVVQLPLALDKIMAGESPYGADYSDSILGKQARVSGFWEGYPGGNPILRHHAYLPGTHLVMMPFHLSARALGLRLDTRIVTLLFWMLAAWLCLRLVPPRAQPIALALALLNPLVYWHQIFGANDMVVAALLLAALLLGERERRPLAAVVLGFACATKQLAWPFAPFLLVWLAGPRSVPELFSRPALLRLARLASMAAAMFLAVVLPVAALDFRRFWGDIVVYNVGLPGADNYPLGGTPGFGIANFLIVAGAVTTLQDYVPFGRFYVLLVPLGFLLLRVVLREATAASVCLAGSTALLASLYLSRVVHPNYLVLLAVFLPLGLLLGQPAPVSTAAEPPGPSRRGTWPPPDTGVVPFLLLAAAVEIAQYEVMRSTFSDAVAGHAATGGAHLGWSSALLPHLPSLSPDPWGLLWASATAGIALVWLAMAVLGAPTRSRVALGVVAALLLVALPTAVLIRVGQIPSRADAVIDGAGTPRGQDAWLAAALPPDKIAREAWSTSFRRDPGGQLSPSGESLRPAGEGALRHLVGVLPGHDPRLLSLAGAVAAALLLARSVAPGLLPLVLGAAVLGPALVLGVPFGSGDALLLALVLGLWRLRLSRHVVPAAMVLGVVFALFPRFLAAAPFVLAASAWPGRRRKVPTGVITFAVWGALGLVSTGASGTEGIWNGGLRPGLGLANLFLYDEATSGLAWTTLLALIALTSTCWLVTRRKWERLFMGPPGLVAAAAAVLAAQWILPGSSALDLATPCALLTLAATAAPRSAPQPDDATGPVRTTAKAA